MSTKMTIDQIIHEIEKKDRETELEWNRSEAKKIVFWDLHWGYLALEPEADEDPVEVFKRFYEHLPEFKDFCDSSEFGLRLHALRDEIKELLEGNPSDFEQLMLVFETDARWEDSCAETQLIHDIESGDYKHMSKEELYNRPAYRFFSFNVFCGKLLDAVLDDINNDIM